MSEITKRIIAGNNSNVVGNKDSSLILRGTSLKYQFGNKFIDIIKNGKINVEYKEILKIASNENEINLDGIYLIDKDIWIKIGQNSIKLLGSNDSDVYISFLKEQNITQEQKQIALSNIGFYYNTLLEALEANITSGIVYVLGDNKLYVVNNGILKEYITSSAVDSSINNIITNNNQNLYIKGNSLFVENVEYSNCQNDKITLLKLLVLHNGLLSSNANVNYGFRLFMENGQSVLEVDKIIERHKSEDDIYYHHIPIYSLSNNIISSYTYESGKIICVLKYENYYNVNDVITISNGIITEDYTVEEVNDNTITISSLDLKNLAGFYTFLLTNPYILIKDNKLKVIDNDVEHTIIGQITESDFPLLNTCSTIESNVGIYSDNIISIGAKMYDTIFKYRCDYPKYDDLTSLPDTNVQDSLYNLVVPNIFWIKLLIDLAIPKGTIIMWNGSNIPEGWSICDGTDGTPNLVGRFIKAVGKTEDVGEIETDLNDNGELILLLEHLPKHSHPHNEHSHTLSGTINTNTGSSEELVLNLDKDNYNYNLSTNSKTVLSSISELEGLVSENTDINDISKYDILGGTASGGIHTHSVTIDLSNATVSSNTSIEKDSSDEDWPNKPIKIEPRSYALVFIMKTKNFTNE